VKPLDIIMEKTERTFKGFNPYRVVGCVACAQNPRVSPLAAEFLPFREKNKSITFFEQRLTNK
jgi:hypothetical protein